MAHIITDECVACGTCEPECPIEAITEGAEKYVIDQANCTDCVVCREICPMEAIEQLD